MQKKEVFVSLRRDMRHVLWSGLRLHPDVDVHLWMERLSGHTRLIRARLVKPGLIFELSTGRDFDLETLGKDNLHLETLESEMVVVSRHVTKIAAIPEDVSVKLSLQLPVGEQCFRLAAGIEGRWDWFINPREISEGAAVLLAPVPISTLWQPTVA